MSHVGHSTGARREHDTYICLHVGHCSGARREQDTYICHMRELLGEKMGARYIHMSHVGHSRGARREQDTYICHM